MKQGKRIDIRVSEEVFYRLKALGKREMSDFIRRAIIHRLSIKVKIDRIKKKAS